VILAWLVSKLGGIGARLAMGAMVLAIIGFGFWRGMAAIDAAQERAVKAAVSAERNHWTAQIAESNAAVERERAELSDRLSIANSERARADESVRAAYEELRKKNEEMPGGDGCGLSPDRGGLLGAIR
jgi:Skp family chaperone for outer membrane proteins